MKSYLGIDVSKLHLDLSHSAPAKRLANTKEAILPWLKSLPLETILVCEASGGYEAPAELGARFPSTDHPA
jgi:hypothetical protein